MGIKIDGDNDVIKINDTQVVKAQEAAQADTGAATGAPAALTGAANAGATGAPAALTGAVVGDTVSTTAGWGSSTEAGFDSMHVAIDANVVDIAAQKVELDKVITDVGLILAQADKSTVDVAAQKVELDKLITDYAAQLVTVNALLAKLRTHGLIAT